MGSQPSRTNPARVRASLDSGCVDAIPMAVSMPRRARLDRADRAIVITQRLAGTLTLQRIPLNAYRGVAAELKALQGPDTPPTVKLVLRHDSAVHSVVLADDLALDDAVAVWRRWADRLSVAMILRTDGGPDSVVRPMLGAVAVGEPAERRKGKLVRRRPRFSKRRAQR